MSTNKSNSSSFAACVTCAVAAVLVLGCFVHIQAQPPENQQNKEQAQAVAKEGIDSMIRMKKVSKVEGIRNPTRYSLELLKPVPLTQLLRSDIVERIVSTGASVKFQRVSGIEAEQWHEKLDDHLTTVVVRTSKGEFTYQDEMVFFVHAPAAEN